MMVDAPPAAPILTATMLSVIEEGQLREAPQDSTLILFGLKMVRKTGYFEGKTQNFEDRKILLIFQDVSSS